MSCAINEDLKKEWQEYLDQTKNHVQLVRTIFERVGLDPETDTPGRKVVRHLGESLVKAMKMAKSAGKPAAAQLVAAECVVLAETKDHLRTRIIMSCLSLPLLQSNGVVPIPMEAIGNEIHQGQFVVADLETGWIRT